MKPNILEQLETEKHTSLESTETKKPSLKFSTYRAYKRHIDLAECIATEDLYEYTDIRDNTKRFENLIQCREDAYFNYDLEEQKIFVTANQCRLRWCPLCAQTKKYYIVESLTEALKDNEEVKFLTLTMRHKEAPLAEQLNELYDAFKKFRRIKKIKNEVKGGVWFFQVHKSKKDNLWHPHLHILIISPFISQSILSSIWKKVSIDSYILDIRKIRKKHKIIEYVARYCARPARLSNLKFDDQLELFDALHGRRISGSWKCLKGVNLTGKPGPIENEYRKIGSWKMLFQIFEDCEAARKVFKAWATQETVQDISFIEQIEIFINGGIDYALSKLDIDIPPP